MQFVVGIDIGATNFRIGIMDGKRELLAFQKIKTAEIVDGGDTVGALERIIKEQCEPFGRPAAVVMGFPAIVSKDNSIVYQSPNVKGFDGINYKTELSARVGCPVCVEKDSHILLSATLFELEDVPDVVTGTYLGTGVGNSIYINGRFVKGKNGAATELGHIPLFMSENRCGCGNIGCAESECGGRVLAEYMKSTHPDADIADAFSLYGNEPFFERYLEAFATAMGTQINLLDPDLVILGGGVIEMKGFPKERMEQKIMAHVRRPYPASNLSFTYAESVPEIGVRGACYYAYRYLVGER